MPSSLDDLRNDVATGKPDDDADALRKLRTESFDADPADAERVCALLAQTSLFSSFSAPEIARLARGVREVRAAKGDILFHRGDPCTGFYLLLSGQVKLAFISSEGNEKVVEILHAGQSFGEAVMVMDTPHVVMAQTLAESKLLHVAKGVFFDEMAVDPMFCRKIIASMAERLHGLISDVESYSLRSGRERIIGYLLRQDELASESSGKGVVSVRLPTSKGTIASRLNLTQEHFSRILHELSEAHLIRVEGRTIHILDMHRLRHKLP